MSCSWTSPEFPCLQILFYPRFSFHYIPRAGSTPAQRGNLGAL